MNQKIQSLPILPIKNSVLFPGLLMRLTTCQPSSVAAIDAALESEDKELLIITQRDSSVETPTVSDLYSIGSKATVKRMIRHQDGCVNLIVQGVDRITLIKIEQTTPCLVARAKITSAPEDTNTEIEAMRHAILAQSARAIKSAQPSAPADLTHLLADYEDPLQLTYLIGSVLGLPVEKEQGLLEAPTRLDALRLLHSYLALEPQHTC